MNHDIIRWFVERRNEVVVIVCFVSIVCVIIKTTGDSSLQQKGKEQNRILLESNDQGLIITVFTAKNKPNVLIIWSEGSTKDVEELVKFCLLLTGSTYLHHEYTTSFSYLGYVGKIVQDTTTANYKFTFYGKNESARNYLRLLNPEVLDVHNRPIVELTVTEFAGIHLVSGCIPDIDNIQRSSLEALLIYIEKNMFDLDFSSAIEVSDQAQNFSYNKTIDEVVYVINIRKIILNNNLQYLVTAEPKPL